MSCISTSPTATLVSVVSGSSSFYTAVLSPPLLWYGNGLRACSIPIGSAGNLKSQFLIAFCSQLDETVICVMEFWGLYDAGKWLMSLCDKCLFNLWQVQIIYSFICLRLCLSWLYSDYIILWNNRLWHADPLVCYFLCAGAKYTPGIPCMLYECIVALVTPLNFEYRHYITWPVDSSLDGSLQTELFRLWTEDAVFSAEKQTN